MSTEAHIEIDGNGRWHDVDPSRTSFNLGAEVKLQDHTIDECDELRVQTESVVNQQYAGTNDGIRVERLIWQSANMCDVPGVPRADTTVQRLQKLRCIVLSGVHDKKQHEFDMLASLIFPKEGTEKCWNKKIKSVVQTKHEKENPWSAV